MCKVWEVNCDRIGARNVCQIEIKQHLIIIKTILLLRIVYSRGEKTICSTKTIKQTRSVYENMSYNIAKYHFWNMTRAVSALRTAGRGRGWWVLGKVSDPLMTFCASSRTSAISAHLLETKLEVLKFLVSTRFL